MQKLIFATNNQHKVDEMKFILDKNFEINSLTDVGINIEIPEPHNSLQENALEKSKTVYKLTNTNCFGEDTGLEVNCLHGAPGVKSARYAGENKSFEKNIDKLLLKLRNIDDKTAQFRTIISLIFDGKEYTFEGICKGKIIEERIGTNGFGYDSIFIPEGANNTFAEMSMDEKNKFSHRKKAALKLAGFLNKITSANKTFIIE